MAAPMGYVKMGGGVLPGGKGCGALGVGARWHQGKHGLDLSGNFQLYSVVLLFNDVLLSAGAQYLYYPWCEGFYVGGGAGIGYVETSGFVPLGGYGSYVSSSGLVLAQATAGYEFRRGKRVRPFVEVGVSQPVSYFSNYSEKTYSPGAVLTFGLGF